MGLVRACPCLRQKEKVRTEGAILKASSSHNLDIKIVTFDLTVPKYLLCWLNGLWKRLSRRFMGRLVIATENKPVRT